MRRVVYTVYERAFYQRADEVPDDFDVTDTEAVEELWCRNADRGEDMIELEESVVTAIQVMRE
jgi:hypothetical protein